MRVSDEKYPIFLIKCFDSMGITKAQAGAMFAKIAGIEESAGKDLIYRYCAGTRRPGRANAMHLAKLLNLSVEEVLNGARTLRFVPTLRSTFAQKGDNLIRYCEALQKEGLATKSTPLFNTDEFGYDALDYCVQNENCDGVLYLLKNNYCKLTKHFSHISHPYCKKDDVNLQSLLSMALTNDNVELFDIIYPKANKYIYLGQEYCESNDTNLYETSFNHYCYSLFNRGPVGKLKPEIHNYVFKEFKLNEKIFMQRNSSLIKNEELMNLYSFNGLANILLLKLRSFDKEMLDVAMVENGVILESVYNAGIKDYKKLELQENGDLFLFEDNKKYWITTLIVIPEAGLLNKPSNDVIEYKHTLNIKKTFEFLKDYNEHFEEYENNSREFKWED